MDVRGLSGHSRSQSRLSNAQIDRALAARSASTVNAVEGPVDEAVMPTGVPGLRVGLDAGQEIGAGALLRRQTLGAKGPDLAIQAVYVDGQRPAVLDDHLAADDNGRDVTAHRPLDE